MDSNANMPGRDTLPALWDGFEYGLELEEVLRLAAWVGARGQGRGSISFSSVLIAYLVHDRPVSRWFQQFAKKGGFRSSSIFSEYGFNISQLPELKEQVNSGALPTADPLMSQSFLQVLRNAMDLAKLVGGNNRRLGGRHLMGAYVLQRLPDHVDQIRRWGIDHEVWQRQFLIFAVKQYPKEAWESVARSSYGVADWNPAVPRSNAQRKQSPNRKSQPSEPNNPDIPSTQQPSAESVPTESSPSPRNATTLYSDFGADNPFATNLADLLKVDSEASAFARLVAAKDINPPLAIGIFGEWGSGKTFFMRKMREHIKQLSEESSSLTSEPADRWPYLKDVVQIQFDAWHYAEENLWASLVDYIFGALDAWMLDKSTGDPAGVDHVLDRLATTQQLKLDALETLILRRSERQAAEARAAQTRSKYQEALKRREAIKPSSYLLAAIKSYVKNDAELRALHDNASKQLGIPELMDAGEQLESAINEARTEAGRAKLVTRSLFSMLGTGYGIAGILTVLILLPALVVALKESLANVAVLAWLNEIKGSVLAVMTFVAGAAASLSKLVVRARDGISKLDKLDHELQKQIELNRAELEKSNVASQDREAQEQLQKTRQAFEAAEAALSLADANLLSARQDFESGTARGRLNQFIRSKVTSGEYAKHLGIVAAIRRDFSQLASLMNMSNNAQQEKEDRERLSKDALARVDRFIAWLKNTRDVKLTIREVTELMNFLEPADALEKIAENQELLKELLPDQHSELDELKTKLSKAANSPRELPRFSRIVLYIDDLDRCPAKKVVDVLQAVHLLLSFPLFAVVVAVDSRWVSRALRDHYPGLLSNSGEVEINASSVSFREPGQNSEQRLEAEEAQMRMERSLRSQEAGGARPYDYLEKIFQIPYWVRPMDPVVASDFIEGIASSRKRTREDPILPLPKAGDSDVAMHSVRITATATNLRPPGPDGQPPVSQPDPSASVTPPAPSQTSALTNVRVHEGVSLEKEEIAMLKRFAPFVGETPRRAIRFVNIYRLVKTSMPDEMREGLVGKDGRSAQYRALISQLAVANGMPQVASYFFEQVMRASPEASIQDLQTSIMADAGRYIPGTLLQLPSLLSELRSSGTGIAGAENISVKHMREMIGFARRYSFERH